MKQLLFSIALVPALLAAGDSAPFPVRGKSLTLAHIQPAGPSAAYAVVFLPGDGGWRGAAVTMAGAIASWGYDVYGFDTRKYLEMFSQDGSPLSQDQLAGDMICLARHVGGLSNKRVVFVGWSQGAVMAVAAASSRRTNSPILGVITLGLPEFGVLGWDWKATLAVLARRQPDQPQFSVIPHLRSLAPTPLWMIRGSNDEYTLPATAQALFQAAAQPKRLHEVAQANHRFDGHQSELFQSIRNGLEWIVSLPKTTG